LVSCSGRRRSSVSARAGMVLLGRRVAAFGDLAERRPAQ
jgi:hypothetical protein